MSYFPPVRADVFGCIDAFVAGGCQVEEETDIKKPAPKPVGPDPVVALT